MNIRNISMLLAFVAAVSLSSCDDKSSNPVLDITVDTFPLSVSVTAGSVVEGSFEFEESGQPSSVQTFALGRVADSFDVLASRIGSGGNEFEAGDNIGLYAVEYEGAFDADAVKGKLEPAGNVINNHPYSYTSSSTWSSADLPNPLTWRKVSLYAYHPYSSTVVDAADATSVVFTQSLNQSSSGRVVSSLDYLMYGVGNKNATTGYDPTAADFPTTGAELTFSHKSAVVKLTVTLRGSYAGKTIESVDAATVLSVPTTAVMNLADGSVTYPKDAKDKVISGNVVMKRTAVAGTTKAATYEAVILPTSYTLGSAMIEIGYTNSDNTTGVLHLYANAAVKDISAQKVYSFSAATMAEEFCFVTERIEAARDGAITYNGLTPASSQFTIRSSSALTWTVTSSDASWINMNVTGTDVGGWHSVIAGNGPDDAIRHIQVQSNTTGLDRFGKLTLSATDKVSVELLVYQKGAPQGVPQGVSPDPTDNTLAVAVVNLYWALGNLVANGANACEIGTPTDYGLYFQFGGLVGWSGGANGDGKGAGSPELALKVKPAVMSATPTTLNNISDAGNTISGVGTFNYTDPPYSDNGQNIRAFNLIVPGVTGGETLTLGSGKYASIGVGDPCTYYLGGEWRLPTPTEYGTLFNNNNEASSWTGDCGWVDNSACTGILIGVRFIASGVRDHLSDLVSDAGSLGSYWGSLIGGTSGQGNDLAFNADGFQTSHTNNRTEGYPARCVHPK